MLRILGSAGFLATQLLPEHVSQRTGEKSWRGVSGSVCVVSCME